METNKYITFADKILDYNKVSEDSKNQIILAFASCLELYVKYAWHDSSEEPQQGRLMLGIERDDVAIYKWIWQDPKGWPSFIKYTGLSKWAYIDDLLPK